MKRAGNRAVNRVDDRAGSAPRPIRQIDRPHHDGSPRYTEPGSTRLGDRVAVRVRVPHAARADRVRLRSTPDAEPRIVEARIDREDPGATWWVADLDIENPVTSYRFLLTGGAVGYAWLNEAGLWPHEVPDHADFRIATHGGGPSWLADTVGYQIFLDRFATSGERRDLPDWAIPQRWGDPIDPRPGRQTRQLFGGDFAGVEKRLDHLERLGVNLVYLTPFFPARSSHRYDASSFEHADPLLGGDRGLISLIAAAHARGIRVLGDITLNHTGDHHEWFERGRNDPASIESGFYLFDDSEQGYVAWHGVPSLPKLDHRSEELARRLVAGDESVIAKYLRPPFGLDGWRVDCANTTARHGDVDLNATVAERTRSTLESIRPDGWLLAEHCYDAGPDLHGPGWHGAMAYQWFSRPLWSWLRGEGDVSLMAQLELPQLGGEEMVASMRQLGADVAWSARHASMTMLDSHDSARFRTAVGGDRRRHAVGMAALLTMPGVPTIFAGSEVGVEGADMDTCRVPFPWDEAEWDDEHFERTRSLIAVRRRFAALRTGSMRWLAADDDSVTYVRELDDEAVVVHLARRAGASATVDLLEAGLGTDATAVSVDGAEQSEHSVAGVVIGERSLAFDGDSAVGIVAMRR